MKRRKAASSATGSVETPSFSSLVEHLEDDARFHGLRQKLRLVDSQPIIGGRGSKAARTDAESSAAYKSTSKDAAKWLRQISHNAFSEQLCLEGVRGSLFQSPASAVKQATVSNAFERELEAATNASGVTQDALKDSRALPMAEKIKDSAAHQRLAQLRAILFREQRKNKRLKKIKSRMWRRVNRRAEAKEFETLLGRLTAENPEVAAKIRADLEEKRASLRMLRQQTARKHWTKVALRYGGKSMQKVVSHEAQRANDYKQSITQATKGHGSPDSSDLGESSEDASDCDDDYTNQSMDDKEKSFLKNAKEILKLGPHATNDDAKCLSLGGLGKMKFMQRAANAKQLEEFLEAEAFVNAHSSTNATSIEGESSENSDINDDCERSHVGDMNASMDKEKCLNQSQRAQVTEFSSKELEAAAATVRPLLENAWGSSSLTTPTADTRSTKRKETQNTQAPPIVSSVDTSAAIEQLLTNDGIAHEFINENSDQAELIREAWAQSDVKVSQLGEASPDDEDPLTVPNSDFQKALKHNRRKGAMAGWGEWIQEVENTPSSPGSQKTISTATENESTAGESPTCKRQYYISRRLDKKLANYFVPMVPHPYSTKQQFELVQQQPIGPEWNTEEVHRRFVKPQVMVRDGTVIMPLENAKNLPKAELDGLLDAWTNRSKAARRLQAARKRL